MIQRFFKNYVWRFSMDLSKQKTIYLTFDDGPTPKITKWTLDTLKQFNAKATFFCIGKNVENHPKIFNQIIADGHSIGNHTHNHLNGWETENDTYIENVLKAEESLQLAVRSHQSSAIGQQSQTTINHQLSINSKKQKTNSNLESAVISNQSSAIGQQSQTTINHQPSPINHKPTTNLFRPPYGKTKSSQAKQLIKKGYKIIMWDVLSADFDQSISSKKCLDNVLKNTQNGSVIVFHDSVKAEKHLKYVLPKMLEYFSKKGYTFSNIALPN